MLASTVGPAFAAQMEFRSWVSGDSPETAVKSKFQGTVILNYDEGGMLADELRDKSC